MKENLSLELYEKHAEALGLDAPMFFESENDLFKEIPSPAKSAVVFLPKSKALIDMTLALVSGLVEEDGKIVLAGSNDAGIRSAKDAYEKNIGPVEGKIVGNHSALYVGRNKKLAGDKKLENFLSYSGSIYGAMGMEAACMPGVFSAGELDEGTKLLLDTIPYDKNKVLDIGCGAGIIGSIYKKKNPAADITMSDVSKLAVFAAQKTLKKNELAARVVESDVFDSIAETFDLILCNPPFHKGVGTDYSFMEKFAKGVTRHLNRAGEAYIVANSFLAYEDVLKKHIKTVETVDDTGKFKVLKCKA